MKGHTAASTKQQIGSLLRCRGTGGRGRAGRDGCTAITSKVVLAGMCVTSKVDASGGQKSGTVWARLKVNGNGKHGAFGRRAA